MAHFCKLDENNVVTQVIVVDNKDITDPFSMLVIVKRTMEIGKIN